MGVLGCVHHWPDWREAEYIANGQSLCSKHMAEYRETLKQHLVSIKFESTFAPPQHKQSGKEK